MGKQIDIQEKAFLVAEDLAELPPDVQMTIMAAQLKRTAEEWAQVIAKAKEDK